MSLPYANPALPANPNPYFTDNTFVRGDQQRANNGFIWGNLEDLDTRVVAIEEETIKTAIDYSKPLGEVFFLPDEKATNFTFDPENPRDYFPAICLSAIEGSEFFDNADTNAAFINYMRTIKVKYLPGRSGEVSSWSVTVSGTTVTFPNTVSANAILAALVEDGNVSGNTNSILRFLQISGVVYTVVTSTVNLVARTMTVSSAPPTGTQTAEWYAYKNTDDGGANQIEITALSGNALMTPNDTNNYFVSNLRTRGFFQGHTFGEADGFYLTQLSDVAGGSGKRVFSGNSGTRLPIQQDGTNGAPLYRKITHGPALTLIPYMWCGGE